MHNEEEDGRGLSSAQTSLRLRLRQKGPDPTNLERHYDPISAKRLKIEPLPAHHIRKLGLVKKKLFGAHTPGGRFCD